MNLLQTQWENLHTQPRFQPLYPNEAVVRFLMTQFPREPAARNATRVLDLGCGAGRHTVLFAEHGFNTFAVDFSEPGLAVTHERLRERHLDARLACAAMDKLPFEEVSLDGVLSFGVLYYNDWLGAQRAVNEIHRVLKPGGMVNLVTRTTRDYRYGKGKSADSHSFVLDITETNEREMLMCFLERADVGFLFEKFRELIVDRSELTTDEWRVDSDWIVTATK